MTAAKMLHSWDACRPVLKKSTAWLTLLRIAAAGLEGIPTRELRRNRTACTDPETFRNWATAGLITITPATHNHIYTITEKGLLLLRLKPEPVED